MAPSPGGSHRAGRLNSCTAVILAAAVAGTANGQGGATGLSECFEVPTTRSRDPKGGFDVNHIVAISQQDNLFALAATVRAGVAAMGCAMNDVFCHAFAVGHALIEAQTHVGHGRWQSWVLAECGLSLRSASDYMRIARHEEFLKAEIGSTAADWSLRGALRAAAVLAAAGIVHGPRVRSSTGVPQRRSSGRLMSRASRFANGSRPSRASSGSNLKIESTVCVRRRPRR